MTRRLLYGILGAVVLVGVLSRLGIVRVVRPHTLPSLQGPAGEVIAIVVVTLLVFDWIFDRLAMLRTQSSESVTWRATVEGPDGGYTVEKRAQWQGPKGAGGARERAARLGAPQLPRLARIDRVPVARVIVDKREEN